jgi:DNA-directed RNA polymerase specialized sigma24 family protein
MADQAKVSLQDVESVWGFAGFLVDKALGRNGHMTGDERLDALSEAVLIMYELDRDWQPEQSRNFSSWCLLVVPRRLIDWWRQQQSQGGRAHRSTLADGKRAMAYHGTVPLVDEDGNEAGVCLVYHDARGLGG